MQKFEIQLNLEHIKQARKAYNDAAREFGERVDKAMKRLIHEAAAQRMSINAVAHDSGFSVAQIKSRMKAMNLNPTTGKTLLSRQAAAVLESNAEIMGIEPREIDLMSPLAYLPAGSLLKDKAQSKGVTDLDEAKPLGPEARQMIAKLEDAGCPAEYGESWLREVLAEARVFPETPLSRGWWCRDCLFFEEDYAGSPEPCKACGCGPESHARANVMPQRAEAGA